MKTNKKMMILSFFGIILVVLGHTGNQIKLFSDLFPYYSFHMPLFVFISGYFYNTKNENKLWGKNGYVLKKIKKMVIPYFIWNFIYGIIVMILKKLNIISYGQNISFNSFFIQPWINGHQYILNISSWFVLALFLVNIVYILIKKILTKANVWNDYVFTFIFSIISMICIYISKINTNLLYIPFLRTGFFIFFYQLGYLYKTKIENKIRIRSIIYFLSLIIIQLIVLKLEGNITYVAVFMQFNNKFLITPIIVSVTGILWWLRISKILVPVFGKSKIVNYISNNTYDIMQHHLFYMFIINVIIWKVSDIFNLTGFNIETFRNTIYYCYTAGVNQSQIIYTITGILCPLMVRYIYEKIKYYKFDIKNGG